MIKIFKNKTDIPQGIDYIELNDLFFNQNTSKKLDERAEKIVEKIDDSTLLGKYKILSQFDGITLNIDRLSTGCKTLLNVLYYPDKVFCMKECGENALELLFNFEHGMVYSDYAIMPFDMPPVMTCTQKENKMIDDYEELKEWWCHEE